MIKIIHKLRKKYDIKRYRNKVVVLAPTFVQIETKSVRIGQVVIIQKFDKLTVDNFDS